MMLGMGRQTRQRLFRVSLCQTLAVFPLPRIPCSHLFCRVECLAGSCAHAAGGVRAASSKAGGELFVLGQMHGQLCLAVAVGGSAPDTLILGFTKSCTRSSLLSIPSNGSWNSPGRYFVGLEWDSAQFPSKKQQQSHASFWSVQPFSQHSGTSVQYQSRDSRGS